MHEFSSLTEGNSDDTEDDYTVMHHQLICAVDRLMNPSSVLQSVDGANVDRLCRYLKLQN